MRARPATVLRALLGAFAVVAGVIACSGIITGPDAGPDTSPRSMRVTPPRLELSLTDTARMSANLYDVTGAAAVLDPAIRLRFSSANPLIARVDDAGLVTAVADGTTIVTAAYGAFSLGIPVVVLGRPRLVIVSGDAQTAEQGDTLPLPLVVRALDAASLPAANRSVTFRVASGSGALFTVQSLTDVNGLASARWVLGLPLGAQSVAVTSAGSDSALFAATATAGTRPVRVAITAPLTTLAGPGATTTMTAAVFNVANVALPAATVTWTSKSPAVATVSGTGLVTALTPGTAYIRAASGSAADSVLVTVNVPPSIAVAPASLTYAWTIGSAVPATQAVAVTNGGGGSLSGLSSSITYGAGATGWLSATLNATIAPATLTVTLVPGSTSAGTYTATVRVASSLAGVAARDVAVTLTVSPPAVLPKLQLGADFTHPAGLQVARGLALPFALTGAQSFTLRSLDTEAILLAADAATLGGSSISVNALAGATSVTYWVQGMERSSGTVARLVAEAAGFEPDTIDVTMVRPAARLTLVGPGTVPASGGDEPVLQVTVGRNDGGTLVPMRVRAFGVAPTFDVFATDFIALMRFRATAATIGADQGPTICVSFDLRPGQSATMLPDPAASVPASLSVVRSGAAGTAGFVLTSLVTEYDIIGGNPALTMTAVPVPVIGAVPASLGFTTTTGATSPAPQQVAVTNVGSGTLAGLSATVAYGAGASDWLAATFDVTAAPATLTLTPTTDLQPTGTFSATVTISSTVPGVAPVDITVTLTVLPPARIVIVSGNNQVGGPGAFALDSLKVRVLLADGSPLGDAFVAFTVSTDGGSVSPADEVTDSDGYVATRWAMSLTPGTHTVTASRSGFVSAVFTGTVAAVGGVATRLAVTTQPAGAVLGVDLTTQPVVEVRDAANVVVAGSTATVTAAITSGDGTLSGTTTVSAVAGVARFTTLRISGARGVDPTITFTSAGLASAVATPLVVAEPVGPSFTTEPVGLTITEGQNAQFVVAVSGTPTPTLQWQQSTDLGSTFSDIAGETGTTLAIVGATLAFDGRFYRAIATNVGGTIRSAAARLEVLPLPPPCDIGLGSATVGGAPNTVGGSFCPQTATVPGVPNGAGMLNQVWFESTPGVLESVSVTYDATTGAIESINYFLNDPTRLVNWSCSVFSFSPPACAGANVNVATGVFTLSSTVLGLSGNSITLSGAMRIPALPRIAVAPTSLTFNATVGAGDPPAQQVAITNAGAGTLTGLSRAVVFNGVPNDWFSTVALDLTTAPATLTVSTSTNGIPPGTYTATITVASSVADVAPVAIPVTLVVAPAVLPKLSLGPDLTHPAGLQAERSLAVPSSVVDPVMVTLRSLDPTALLIGSRAALVGAATDSAQIEGGTDQAFYWLSGIEGTAGRAVTIIASAPGYLPDTMVVTLKRLSFQLTPAGATGVPAAGGDDPVMLLGVGDVISGAFVPMAVRIGGTPPSFTLTSQAPSIARLRFVAGSGVVGADQGPANQITFGIDAGTNSTSGGFFIGSPANILLARTGTAGTVQVDAVGSAEYDGFLTGVQYALSGAPVPVIAVAPAALGYVAESGATTPLPRQVVITNTGAGTLSGLTADVLYGAGASDWLSVAFDVTTAPATLTVVAFTDFVPVGSFTATITLASTVPGVAPVNIPVTITITPGARIVIVSGNGQSAARGQYLPDSLKVRAIGLGDVPVGDQTVEFTVSANGGSVSLISLETDENGYAAVRWLMPSVPGTYAVTAGFPGYASAVFTGTALAGTFVTRVRLTAPRTSLTGAGDSQQFAAAAYNIADSLIASAAITWASRTATVATVSPTGLVTAVAAGQSWIVASVDTGSGSGIDSVLVTVAAPPPPALVLALVNTPLVGVNGTAIVRVTLSQPAPIGGVSLSLVSGDPSVAIVNAPASVTVAAGATSADFTLTGISTGGVTLSATATGYTTGTLAVTVSTNTISVPLTLNVPYTRSASLPINLTQPAPVGGTLITITSGNPAIVGVLTPTVLIPAGQLSGNAQLAGTTLGQVAVTATGPNLATGTSSVRVTAALDILESSVNINAGFSTTSVTTRLLSGGTPFAAPAGGIPLTFTSRNPACVAAPTDVAVAAGLSSVATTAGYGGSASTPCATYLVVTSSQFDPDSMAITVNPQPLSYLNVSASVGAGLTRGASFSFQVVAPPGGAVVTLTSSDSTRLVLARTADVVGTGSIQITIPPGSYYDSFVYSGVEGQEGLGASISLTVQGGLYASPTPAPVTITPIGVEATGTTSFTTLSADGTGTVFVGEIGAPGPNQAVNNALIVRAGGSPITVTLTSDDDAVVRPVSAGIAATTRTVTINPGQSSTTYGIRPVGAGTARISASSPNAASPVRTSYPAAITVSQPLSYLNVPATVGAGLTKNASFSMQVVAPPGGIVVTLTSSDSTRLVLARTADVVGTGSIQITIPAGGYYDSFVMSGVEGQAGAAASVSMTVQGGLFANPAPVPVSISTIGIQTSNSTSLTTLSADGTGAVYVGELGAAGPSQAVNNALIVRAGGQPITVTLTSADAGVVVPVTASVAGNPRTVTINPGQSSTTFGVRPTGPGSTTISATSPSAASPVATNYPVPITVTQPLSYLNVSSVVGAGLTRAASFSLQVIAPLGGTVVTITSSDSTRLVLARTSDVVGTGSIQITIPAGGYYDSFYMSGVEGQQGTTASVIMTVQGGLFSNPAPGPVTIVPIGVEASGSTSLTTLGGDGNGTVFVGELAAPGPSQAVTNTLNIRAGGQPITVTLTSTTPTVAVPVVAGVAASPRTVTINPGQSSATYSIRPLVAGTTTITATSPQAPSPVRASYPSVLTVTSPSSSLSLPTRLGAGLSTTATVSLQVVAPVGGANITLTSSDPARLLLALDANSPGTTQITVPIPQGGYYASFVVMALEDVTGNPTVTAQTPGFTDATGAISVEPIGVQWAGTSSITTLSTDGSGTVYVGIITGVVGNRSVTPVQSIRFGGVARTITMTSSNAAAVLPVVGGSAQQGAAVTINPGQSSAPVYVRPVGPGSATISPSGAGLIPADAPGVPQTVTVTVPVQSLSITSFTQGAGLAQVPTIALQVVAPAGGRTMTLTSNDPSRLLVAPNENTAGASQISIAFGAGSYYQSFVVMSPENVSGTVTLTASIPGYRDTTFTFTVAQPAVTLNGPPSTRTIAQGDDFFQAQVGIQSGAGVQPQVVRFGAPAALTVTLASSAPAIGTLVIGGNVASPQTIEIAVGQSLSSSIAGTRANFRPLSAGNATITATIPGYLQQGNAIRTVTVSP